MLPAILAFAAALFPETCLAADRKAAIVRPAARLEGLQFSTEAPPLQRDTTRAEPHSIVFVEGTFRRQGWYILLGNRPLQVSPKDGSFRLRVPYSPRPRSFTFKAVGPHGSTVAESITIRFPPRDPLRTPDGRPPSPWGQLSLGANLSAISYKDSRIADFSELGLTVKGSYTKALWGSTWDVGASFYFTALTLSSSTGETARFLGVNGRIGYVLPAVREPWRLTLLGGTYYTTMFVPSRRFGFKSMAGPQLFPVLRLRRGGVSIVGYLKFSPVTDGTQFLAISNREVAGGGAYLIPLKRGGVVSFTLDVANLALKIRTVTISSTSVSLGCALGL
jgi:hypothetical protein